MAQLSVLASVKRSRSTRESTPAGLAWQALDGSGVLQTTLELTQVKEAEGVSFG